MNGYSEGVVAQKSGDRSTYFGAIEKKHGQPMRYWHGVMAELVDEKYAEQIAFLKENHGFSQAHANALVMYSRGSKTSKRFNNLTDYLAPHDAVTKKTVRAIFKAITGANPKMKLVIAWNQPMLKLDDKYIFGVMAGKNHILIAPWSPSVIAKFAPKLKGFEVNKKTIRIPSDWKVDAKLLQAMVKECLAQSD